MKSIIVLLSFLFLSNIAFTQTNLWSDASAQTLKKGRKNWPLLGIKKMGLKNNKELQIQPIFFFLAPNIGLKKYWGNKNGWDIASLHKLHYPSLMLKTIAREGTGGVLPKSSVIPQIIGTKNELIVSKVINEQYFFAARLGVDLALSFGDADFAEIDLPFIYNRTAVYHSNFIPYLGLHLGGTIVPKLDFELAFTALKMTNDTGGFVFEDKAVLFWKLSDKFGIKAGAASAFGRYAYGNDFKLIPVFDVVFGFGKDKGED